jgi:hypothetical protein
VSAASRPRILSPQEGSVYFLDPTLGAAAAIRFAGLGDEHASWILDGRELGHRGEVFWTPDRGEHELVMETPSGADRVRFAVR